MNRRRFVEHLLTAPLLAATLAGSSARAAPQPRASPAKLTLLHVRAADVALALGGSVIDDAPTTTPEQSGAGSPAWGKASATQLLPDGITSILAYKRDNSLLVQFDDPAALAAFRDVIRLLDVAPRRIEVRAVAEAFVRDGGRVGRTARVELRTITLSGQGARAASSQQGEDKSAAPRISAFEWYVEPAVLGGATGSFLRVTATGSVTVAWQKPGAKTNVEPVRVQHFFDGTTQTPSGSAAVVSRATLPLGDTGAVAEITLTLTPRLLPGGDTPTVAKPAAGLKRETRQ